MSVTAFGVASRPSAYSVEQTLQRLEQVIGDRGLTIFARYDHSGEAAQVGLSLPPTQVLVFGNPRAGTPLIVASPLIALDLPLRILVWQDPSGKTYVSSTEPAYLAERFTIPPELVKVVAMVEEIVAAATGNLVTP
jgi:uncharacterized protein (DUF302 family)